MHRCKLLLCIMIGCFSSQLTVAQTALWKISKGEAYFYLGGTIHLLKPSDYPLPAPFFKAYDEASVMYFETLDSAKDTTKKQNELVNSMMYENRKIYAEDLTIKAYAKVSNYINNNQLSGGYLARFKPWAIIMIVSFNEIDKAGYRPLLGVDQYFENKARKDKKKVKPLETLGDQFDPLVKTYDGEVDKQQLSEDIIAFFDNIESVTQNIDAIKENWREGVSVTSYNEMPETDVKKKMNELLLKNRNDKWLQQIELFIHSSEIEMVLVGYLHLVGPNGLLEALEHKGYTLEQL